MLFTGSRGNIHQTQVDSHFWQERNEENGKAKIRRKGIFKSGRSFLEKTDGGDYLAFYKKRTLIIRLAFEQYLLKNPKVKEELINSRSRKRED